MGDNFVVDDGILEKNLELANMAKPLADYLKKNYHPHATIIITCERVAVLEDLLSMPLSLLSGIQHQK